MNIVIASNSLILRNILTDILKDGGHNVLGSTSSGKKVLEFTNEFNVDIIILGENLSECREDEVIKRIGSEIPIIVLGTRKDLIEIGAKAVIDKPEMEQIHDSEFVLGFLDLIQRSYRSPGSITRRFVHKKRVKHIVIGSSTGGPNALKEILSALPENFPVPISIVQHLEEGHEEGLASWLKNNCKLNVRLAVNNDNPLPGEVILGIQNKHLTVESGRFHLSDGEKINFQKPAIDLQFSTAAKYFGDNLIGVLLTGMGSDGAKGCLEIINNGGFTIVQDEETSAVYGMPKAAVELGAASIVLPLDKIAGYILSTVKVNEND